MAEGNKLKELLGYEIELKTSPNVPLFTTKKQINDELDKFRRAITKRKEKIRELRYEEMRLCLGELFFKNYTIVYDQNSHYNNNPVILILLISFSYYIFNSVWFFLIIYLLV